MSKRAEEAALKAYPKETRDKNDGMITDIGCPQYIRNYYMEGYEQAEKDLALTWEDIKNIIESFYAVNKEIRCEDYGTEKYFTDILKRFNEQRKK